MTVITSHTNNTIADPWQLHLSKHGHYYFFNKSDGTSKYEPPVSDCAEMSAVKQLQTLSEDMSAWLSGSKQGTMKHKLKAYLTAAIYKINNVQIFFTDLEQLVTKIVS